MTIIEVRASKKFKGAWVALKRPVLNRPSRRAVDYASNRFGGRTGEVHAYDDDGLTIERTIKVDGRCQYERAT